MQNINIALLGFGTVGSGVYRVLKDDYESIIKKLKRFTGKNFNIKIKRILEIRPEVKTAELGDLVTDKIEDIFNDEIDIVCELIGGDELAIDYMKQAMDRGIDVVTANKMAIFKNQGELLNYARQKGVLFKYEASVAGAIPLIKALEEFLIAEEIQEIQGIFNGSTNFILSRLSQGMSYEDALEEARKRGYLEADPSSDLLGYDTMYKLGILANLFFGEFPCEAEIERQGINLITADEIEAARDEGNKIKLVASVLKIDHQLRYSVKPRQIGKGHPLYDIDNSINGILFRCKNAGDIFFAGAGAGSKETAVSVLSDIVSIIKIKCA